LRIVGLRVPSLASEENEVEKKPVITARVGKTAFPVEGHSTALQKYVGLKVTIEVATRAKVFSGNHSVKLRVILLWRGYSPSTERRLKIFDSL